MPDRRTNQVKGARAPEERSWLRHPIVAGAAATVLGGVILSLVALVLPNRDDGPGPASPSPRLGAPLLVSAERDWDHLANGALAAVVDPIDLEAYAANDGVSDVIRQVYADGVVDANTSALDVVLENVAGSTATITDARVRFIERRPPDPEAYLVFEGGSVDEVVSLHFDLDDPQPTALEYRTDTGPGGPYFAERAITLTPGETIPLRLTAHAEEFDCVWVVELTVVVAGEPRTVVLDDHGQPFRTVGDRAEAPRYTWTWWEPDPSFQPVDG